MQLALRYPNTVFVGLDILYKESRKIYTSRRGLQLTHGDWRELKTIPDKSIDTILSLQGIGMWGLPGSPNFDATNEDGIRIVNSLTRIAKSGCVLRMDFLYGQELEFLRQNMPSNGWELENKHRLIIARKL